MSNISYTQWKNILEKTQQTTPVAVIAIASDLGINVYSGIGEGLSGMIIKDNIKGGPSGYAIFVNKKDSSKRQRFTIAHEIAHFILHKDAIGDRIVDDALYRSGLTNAQEVEANKLAAEILMPWHLINKVMNEKTNSIQELANIFQVSDSAMSIRLGVPS